MLGTWRLLLAMMVFASHIPANGLPLHIGFMAVISFYFISGDLMAASFANFARNRRSLRGAIGSFYVDRFLKIFPLYWIALAFTYLLTTTLGSAYIPWQWVTVPDTLAGVVRNIVLIPLNYFYAPYGWGPVELAPAWSLAAELQFYIVTPLICLSFRRVGIAMAIGAAAAVLSSAVFLINLWFAKPTIIAGWLILHEDFGAYRTFWSTVFVFMLGVAFRFQRDKLGARVFEPLAATIGAMILVFTIWEAFAGEALDRIFPRSLLASLLLLLPVTMLFSATARHPDLWQWRSVDKFLGDFSYPFFLIHLPCLLLSEQIWGFGERGLTDGWAYAAYVGLAFSLSLAMAYPLMLVGRAIDGARLKLRGFGSLSSEAPRLAAT
jgi:peptidoglycan/LPS O-acetylase OafA/YrhL